MKNLEKEYKAEISHEAPDLWSRIEAGVDAYEASRKEAAPATPEVPDTKIVKFNGKKIIGIIGKISVAAVLFLVVAATFNMTRGIRKDAAPAATETAMMNDSGAAENTVPSTAPMVEEAQQAESPVDNAKPVAEESASKDSSPSLIVDSPTEYADAETNSEAAGEASFSPTGESEALTARVVTRLFGVGNIEAIKFLTELNNLGLTDVCDMEIYEVSAEDASVYGFETDKASFSVAGFTAGSAQESYLLFYSTEEGSGIDILAVKNEVTGAFLYTKSTAK